MAYEIAGEAADADAVRAEAKAADSARNAATRARNGTAAKPRRGKHAALAAEEKARRKAERASNRKRRSSQRATAEAEREVALSDERDRSALLRLILRGQKQDDIDAAKRPRRMPIVAKADKEPRVTAAGGKRLYRRFELLTGGAAGASASRVARDGLYSIVVRVTPRGFGEEGKKRWRRSEAANLVRYIARADALEREPGLCILSNLVDGDGKDATGRVLEPGTDEWAREHFALWQMIEKLEADAAGVKDGKSKTKVNVYRHLIIPLPHELDADERLELVRQITDVFRARGLPFTAAIHRPDPGGDQRNVHLHIIVSARPSIPVGSFEWQFEALKDPEVFTPEYLLAFRVHVAEQFNQALAQAGSNRVYTHVSRQDRNVEPVDEVHAGRDRTGAQRRAEHVAELARRLPIAHAQLAQIDAMARASRELARLVRTSGDLAAYVLAEVRESVGLVMQSLADPTDLLIESAHAILHSTANTVAEAAAPLFVLTEEAPVRRLPVEKAAHAVAPELEAKAVERPATPPALEVTPVAPVPPSLEATRVPQAAPETTIAPTATREPKPTQVMAAAAEKLPHSPQPSAEVAAKATTSDPPAAAEATAVAAATDLGAEFTARAVTEVAPNLPPRAAATPAVPEAASFKPDTASQSAPGSGRPEAVATALPPFQHANAISNEMPFDEAEKVPIMVLNIAMRDGQLTIAPQDEGATVRISANDLSAARAAATVAETARGRQFLARLATEVAHRLPPRDATSDSFVLKSTPGGASWREPLTDRVLPVVFHDWDRADRHMRAHLNLLLRAMVHPEQYFCAGLGRGLWWYCTGYEQLESAVKALQRDVIGLGILQALASASETTLGSLRSDFPVWRSDKPNQAPRPMTAEMLHPRDENVGTRVIERVAEWRVEPAVAPQTDLFAEALKRIELALTDQLPRARVLSVNGSIEVLVRDVDLVADLKLVSSRDEGLAFIRQRTRQVHELPKDDGWIRQRVAEAPDDYAAHLAQMRWLQQQRGGPGR